MSIYLYRVFHTVVKQGSFSKASKLLNMSPSAVSHSIAKLENEFGFSLLIRGKKQVTLTENGVRVYGIVKDILYSTEILEKSVSQINESLIGTLRLGVIDSITVSWLPEILSSFFNNFPSTDIHITENGYNNLIEHVIGNDLDLAFVSYSSIKDIRTPLQFIPLHEDRIICVSPKGFTPKNGNFITPEELQSMDIILHQDGNEADVVSYLQGLGISIQSRCLTITNSSLIAMVRCGFGHGITPALTLSGIERRDVNIYPIVPYGSRTIGLITNDPKFISPTTKQMILHIQEYVKEKVI